MLSSITLGAVGAYVLAVVLILVFVVALITATAENGALGAIGVGFCGVVVAVLWWWGMAFTLSGDYHAWNDKTGVVVEKNKRIVPAGDKGIQERFVLRFADGQLYGVDDTRASLIKRGQRVRLKCKKDYQWGVPRSSHGWACRYIA